MKLTLTTREIRELLNIPTPSFPKYVSPILNLANRFAQATRPRVVGQLSDLIQQFPGRTLQEWISWYEEHHPDAIPEATRRIRLKLTEFKRAIDSITDEMIEAWVRDLVLVKTFIGLRFQEAILKKVSEYTGLPYALASSEQESYGLDGFIGRCAVSIKPISWKDQVIHKDSLAGTLIYYEKTNQGIEIEFNPADFTQCRQQDNF